MAVGRLVLLLPFHAHVDWVVQPLRHSMPRTVHPPHPIAPVAASPFRHARACTTFRSIFLTLLRECTCNMYCVPCTVYHVPCTVHHVPCTVYHVQCNSVPCTMYSVVVCRVPCPVYHVPCAMHVLYCVPCATCRAPCTVYHVPCTVHHVHMRPRNHMTG